MNPKYSVLFVVFNIYLFLKEPGVTGIVTPTGTGTGTVTPPEEGGESTLELVHVLFRHGNRTPNGPEELYPKDPYLNERYYPFGIGQLTNEGKRQEFRIGQALRTRYNNFLGRYYTPDLVEPVSTDYNRTKMSLELVLASLFQQTGVEMWVQSGYWQPVPYNYLQRSQDKVLLGSLCPHYLKLYNAHVSSRQVQDSLNQYRGIFDYISKNTGLNVRSFQDVYNLQFGLKAEEDYGLQLPSWSANVWPQTLTDLAIKEYFVATGSTELRRMASGYFLQKIITDTVSKINGNNIDRKLYLYSAHEDNIANLMITLNVFEPPHIPNYGAFIVFEVHKINGVYGFRIYYENLTGRSYGPRLLKLPACDTFCPLSRFRSLTKEYMPTPNLCYQK